MTQNNNQKHTQPPMSAKAYMETPSYIHANALLQAEINAEPLKIDYSCFKKSPQEKADLANAKRSYKKMLKETQINKNN